MNATGSSPAGEPKAVIPALEPCYSWTRDLSYPLVRVTAGGMLLVHGIAKLTDKSIEVFAATALARRGIEPALPLAYAVWTIETVGAICIMAGLFTRFFAVAAGIQFAVITFVAHWSYGFWWNRPGGGWEYPLLWGLLFAAIALRGGGPYSIDRKIGCEL
jgi:putative oxidoreductase